nr:FAD-dependent oxidoreductase [Yimella sp. cx-51]
MQALGSAVTMVVRGDQLLTNQEPFAAQAVLKSLRRSGVDVRFNATVTNCERSEARDTRLGRVHGGAVRLTLEQGDPIEADEILVAVGRRPRLNDLGLEQIELNQNDPSAWPDWLVTGGDASGEAPLTHWGKYRARVIGAQLGGADEPELDDVPVPQVIFTDPQVAQVGPLQGELPDAVAVRVPFNSAAGAALLRDHVVGEAQLLVDPTDRVVRAATFVGPEAGELLHAATIAIVGRVPVHLLRHAVPSYPTASELWLRLLEELPREFRSA